MIRFAPKSLEVRPFRLGSRVTFLLLLSGLIAWPGTAQEGEKLLYEDRSEMPEALSWDLSHLFVDEEAFSAAITEAESRLEKAATFAGRLGESPATLAAALDAAFAAQRPLTDVFVYANQTLHLDTRQSHGNDLAARASSLAAKVSADLSFVDPEIAEIPAERLREMLQSPDLETYRHYIDNVVRTREHTLSPEIERVIAGASRVVGTPNQAFTSLENADIQWPLIENEEGDEVRVVPGQYIQFVSSKDRRVRRDAALSLFDTYGQYGNTFAATLSGSIYASVWQAEIRGYDSSLEMALDSTNVPRQVVDTLVQAVNDNIESVHGYATLRKELQDLEQLHIYDLYVDLLPGIKKTYTFEEGWALAMSFWGETFGAEYAAVAQRAKAERWIDVYSNEGKRPGAYSWGSYDSHPYLFLNWTGDLDAVSTLVHEMGHSIHTYLANENQPFHDASYSLFVAEVASVASESLFMEWLLERTTDPDERLLLLNQAMDNVTGTFLRQVFFHEFEAAAHAMAERGDPLTKDSLSAKYLELWQSYYGDDLVVDDNYGSGWARISHFYRNFYVWVYATSYAAGEAIAERFRSGDPQAVQDYLAMLELGGSVYPMEALQRAGIDMNDPAVIRGVMDRYSALQSQLAEALGSPTAAR